MKVHEDYKHLLGKEVGVVDDKHIDWGIVAGVHPELGITIMPKNKIIHSPHSRDVFRRKQHLYCIEISDKSVALFEFVVTQIEWGFVDIDLTLDYYHYVKWDDNIPLSIILGLGSGPTCQFK
jgi:hypothetical protein